MIGLALCGGGMKCAAHLGVLQVMEELGLRPTSLAGSSMGAVIGALYATGMNPQSAAEQLCRTTMSDVFVGGVPFPGLNHARRFRGLLRKIFGDQRIEDLRLPLLITACDLVAGTPLWIDRGSLVDALYASCAVPAVFPPLIKGEKILVDGCLGEPLPVCELRKRGCRKVIGVDFARVPSTRRLVIPSPLHRIEILQGSLSRLAAGELDCLIQPAVGRRSGLWWDRHRLAFYVEAGRASARHRAPELERLRQDTVDQGLEPLRPAHSDGGLA